MLELSRNLLVSDCSDKRTLTKTSIHSQKPEIVQLINEVGDIEKPVPLGMALLKKVPGFLES